MELADLQTVISSSLFSSIKKFIKEEGEAYEEYYGESFLESLEYMLDLKGIATESANEKEINTIFKTIKEDYEDALWDEKQKQNAEKADKEKIEILWKLQDTILPGLAKKYDLGMKIEQSGLSDSFYVTFNDYEFEMVVRFSDHDLPPSYRRDKGSANVEVSFGEDTKYLEADMNVNDFIKRFGNIWEKNKRPF